MGEIIKIKQPREHTVDISTKLKLNRTMVADLCVKGKKAPRQSAKILKSDISAGRNAYPKVLWLPRFSMLITCLQIRDEKSKESKLVSISLVIYVFSRGRNCI